jgi:hypothetical protein
LSILIPILSDEGEVRRASMGKKIWVSVLIVLVAAAVWGFIESRAMNGKEEGVAMNQELPAVPENFPMSRNVYFWPFSQKSIWNMPIGSNAEYAPAGLDYTNKSNGKVTVDIKYLGLDVSAPLTTLTRGDYSHHPKQPASNRGVGPGIGERIHVPANMTADGKLNGSAAFLKEGSLLDYWEANRLWIDPAGSNPRVMHTWGPFNLKSDGMVNGSGGGKHGTVGGLLRPGELQGQEPIRHALRLNVWGVRFMSPTGEGYVWPATRADGNYNHPDPKHSGAYHGVVPYVRMGTLLAIRPDEDLGFITSPKVRKLAQAMRDYGIYITDNTAWDVYGMNIDSDAVDEFTANDIGDETEYYRQMQTLITKLYAITNNGPDSIGGGGTPRAPLAPCFDDEPGCPATGK